MMSDDPPLHLLLEDLVSPSAAVLVTGRATAEHVNTRVTETKTLGLIVFIMIDRVCMWPSLLYKFVGKY